MRTADRVRARVAALAVALSVVALVLLVLLAINAEDLADALRDAGAAKLLVILAAAIVLVPALVPAAVIAAAAGYVLGTLTGAPLALLGITVGGTLAAAIARWVCGRTAPEALGPRVAAFAVWLERRPFRGVLIARLIPVSPYNVVSYAAGLTRIPLATIFVASLVGFAPRTFAYTALGGSFRDFGSPEARWALAATSALVIVSLAAPRIARRRGITTGT